MRRRIVIVGASLAGATAAATLRQEGFDGEIVLVGAEAALPFERPALSKQYLRGEMPFEKMLVRPEAFYRERDVTLRLGVRASRIHPGERTVELQDGERLGYDALLVATGVRNRRPAVPGSHLEGVFQLRTVADADALRREAQPGRRAVVVGAGFIGCEVAASLRLQGVEVTVIDPAPAPLARVLGTDVGQVLAAVHRDHGVEMRPGDGLAAFEGDGRVTVAVTTTGRRIECDFAVVGIGVEPEINLLAGSGIAVSNGILVDQYCRTSVPDIYAAGDVANHFHPRLDRRMRVEHWQNAMQQAATAARTMLGRERPYEPVHWFWSDQYDVNVQYAGAHASTDRLVVRGSLESRSFLAFYLNADERVDAVVAMNRGKDLRRAMPLIASREIVDPRRLADEGVDLRNLAAPAEPARRPANA